MVTGAPKRLSRIVSLASAMTLGLAAIMPTSTMAAAYASPLNHLPLTGLPPLTTATPATMGNTTQSRGTSTPT